MPQKVLKGFYTRPVLQNKQIAASKDAMKDLRLVEKICYFKNIFGTKLNLCKTHHTVGKIVFCGDFLEN